MDVGFAAEEEEDGIVEYEEMILAMNVSLSITDLARSAKRPHVSTCGYLLTTFWLKQRIQLQSSCSSTESLFSVCCEVPSGSDG